MGALDSFLDLCRCLAMPEAGADVANDVVGVAGDGIAWDAVIGIADKETVSPSFCAVLKR